MSENVLVIAPHPDDESIGCGGAICLLRRGGDTVHVAFLTSGERGLTGASEEAVRARREAEAEQAAQVLGVNGLDFLRLPDHGLAESVEHAASQLRALLELRRPTIIYLPHSEESHPDHAATLPIVRAALVQVSGDQLPQLYAYEVWSPLPRLGWVMDISEVFSQKLRAVRCYRSQLELCRYDRAVRGLNRYRGIMSAGSRYAEAFRYYDRCPPEDPASVRLSPQTPAPPAGRG